MAKWVNENTNARADKKVKFYIALVIFSLVGQVAWVVENMYLNVFIYKMFNASAGQISLMVGASAVMATVTTLLIGALSDKLGKRKIFICLGYMLWGISILGFALIRKDLIRSAFISVLTYEGSVLSLCITLTVVLDCIMTFFGSSANDAAFNAWLTDMTDETNRGRIEGINAMMPLIAVLAVFGGFMSLNQDLPETWTVIFLVTGGIVFLLGLSGFFLIEDRPVKTKDHSGYFANIFYGFRPSVIKENGSLYLTLMTLALFSISIQIFMPYLILYYTEFLGLDNYVVIFAPAIILAAVFTAFYGKMFDLKGFRFSVLPTLMLLLMGYIGLYFVRNIFPVFLFSLLMMCGYLGTGAMIGALIREKTPGDKAGMFQGLRIVFQVLIPGVIGPAVGAAILQNAEKVVNADGTTSFLPNRNIFIGASVALIFTGLALVPLFKQLGEGKKRYAE